jgi:hypothetical protein
MYSSVNVKSSNTNSLYIKVTFGNALTAGTWVDGYFNQQMLKYQELSINQRNQKNTTHCHLVVWTGSSWLRIGTGGGLL